MKNNRKSLLATLLVLSFACMTVHQAPAEEPRDADIKERLKGVDLKGILHLTSSPDGKMVAGVEWLNGEKGSGSLVKIWTIKGKDLVYDLLVPGRAHAVAFSPDASTVVAADGKGNLGWETTLRAWELPEGKERKIGTCIGGIHALCFSPDGTRLAYATNLDWSDQLGAMERTGIACVGQIQVQPVAGPGKKVTVNIAHPKGEWVELWPSMEGGKGKNQAKAALERVMPLHLRFSANGKQLVSETNAGLRTTYHAKTGRVLRHPGIATVGLVKAMLMLAVHEAPSELTALTLELKGSKRSMDFKRQADGWWWIGADDTIGFKVDGKDFLTRFKGVDQRETIRMRLGLKKDADLATLEAIELPLGGVQLTRRKTGFAFQLEALRDKKAPAKILQAGEVQWAPVAKERR